MATNTLLTVLSILATGAAIALQMLGVFGMIPGTLLLSVTIMFAVWALLRWEFTQGKLGHHHGKYSKYILTSAILLMVAFSAYNIGTQTQTPILAKSNALTDGESIETLASPPVVQQPVATLVIPTPTPVPNNQTGHARFNPPYRVGEYPYSVLVEYRVNQLPASAHVIINVGTSYDFVEYWFGERKRIDGQGRSSVGQILQSTPKENPPTYEVQVHNISVTPNRSLYIYFGGQSPFTLTNVLLDDKWLDFRRN